MTVLIAGCGDLGTEVGLRLAAAGHTVVGLRRRPRHLPDPIVGQAVDLAHERPEVPDDTEIVIFTLTSKQRTEDAYRATYVDGLRNTLDALHHHGTRPRRVLFVSSTSVYGSRDGRVDEDTPTTPATTTGSVLVEAEQTLHARLPEATTLRLAGLYGPGRTSLIEQVRDGTAVIPREPRHTNRIHRDDAASAIIHLTTAVGTPAPIYVGVDDEPAQRGDVLRFLAAELDVAAPPLGDDAPARGGDKLCSNDRLRSTGFRFTHPSYRQGYRAVLAEHGRPRH